jgi:hypothetical protein
MNRFQRTLIYLYKSALCINVNYKNRINIFFSKDMLLKKEHFLKYIRNIRWI